jgi:putative PIN family toxin of toxin-antitoxin system
MIAAVYDCMVFLQATTSATGPAAACLGLVESGHVGLFVSPDILGEVRRVFLRPSTRKRFPLLTDEKVELFRAKVTALAVVISDVPAAVPLPRDPKDERYLNLAHATKASFLVTRDKDLLSLMGDKAFRMQCPWLSIVDPKAFLDVVRAGAGTPPG